MSYSSTKHLPVRRLIIVAAIFSLPPVLLAQRAPAPAPDTATLAKYDRNHNGVLDPDELAALAADQKKTIPVETNAASAPSSGESPTVLSPFEVVEDTKGYYSANTMSATRFNSKVEDLATSIQIVTKEEMADFAMLDINDVFSYTANTEGTHEYTDFAIDSSGGVADNAMLAPESANRVRGMLPANVSLGNTEMMGTTPIDPLAIDAIEISRGPNATIASNGSPAGTVNMVSSSANLSRDRTQTQMRADSFGGYRTSLDLNRVLVKNVLAVRGSVSFQHDGYDLKPSGVNTVRYNGMVKYQPFKGTTVTGTYQYYRMNGNRANVSPPRDNVSYWLESHRGGYNPWDLTITYDNGVKTQLTDNDAVIPDFLNRKVVSGTNHGWLWIDRDGSIGHWEMRAGTGLVTPDTETQSKHYFTSSAKTLGVVSGTGPAVLQQVAQPLFAAAIPISDKGLYDWSSINLYDVNRVTNQTTTSSIRLDQVFFNTRRQSLTAQVSFQREDAERHERNLFGSQNSVGASGQLMVDVNIAFLNNQPNPFFGRPYLNTGAPKSFQKPSLWDTTRAQFAYKLDLRQEKNVLRWLGVHQITGYDEYKYRISRTYAFRDAIVDQHPWIPAGKPRGDQGDGLLSNRIDGRYYLGDNINSNVDYAPSPYNYGKYIFTWGDAKNQRFNYELSEIGEAAALDGAGGSNNSKQIIKTAGAIWQSHLFDDRIVVTLGLRHDQTYSKSGYLPPTAQKTLPDGIVFNYQAMNSWELGNYRERGGQTTTRSMVVRPFRNLGIVRRISEANWAGDLVAQVLNGLSFHVPISPAGSFKPQTPAQDVFGNQLPNTLGVGKDSGFSLNMFDGKMVLRVNWYQNSQTNVRFGTATSLLNNLLKLDVTGSSSYNLVNNVRTWTQAQNPTWTTDQVNAEIARVTGLSTDVQQGLLFPLYPIATTQDLVAKGKEVELNLNLTRYWTVSASVTQKSATNTNVARTTTDWINQRMPYWTSIMDPRGADKILGTPDDATPVSWWTEGGTNSAQVAFAAIDTPLHVLLQAQGTSNPQIREYNAKFNTNLRLSGLTENRILKKFNIGGSLRYESKGAIGYYGVQTIPDIVKDLDKTRPVYDKAHYYVDTFIGYRTRLPGDKIGMTVQFNIRNIQENGRLQPVGAYPDGETLNWRIIDPRQFILSATFDL